VLANSVAKQGLLEVAQIKAGEILVVSGAAGHVGSLVCQIGKLYGAKVIGIAGTDDKCRWLREELKIDAALNYKSPSFHDEFKNTVGYFDVFFDNVGGEMLDFALTRLKLRARVILCGESEKYRRRSRFTTDIRQARFLTTVRWSYKLGGGDSTSDRALPDVPNPKGISSYMNLLMQRAKLEGFIV